MQQIQKNNKIWLTFFLAPNIVLFVKINFKKNMNATYEK